MVKLTEMVLDDLVAGELSRDQYRAVLRQLEATPDGWRRLALAFLEDQALKQDLGQLLGEHSAASLGIWSEHVETRGTDGARSLGLVQSAALGVEGKVAESDDRLGECRTISEANDGKGQAELRVWGGSGGHGRLEWLTRFTSLAALLLVSFTIGWFGSDVKGWRSASSPTQEGSVSSQTSASNSRSDVAAADLSDGQPAIQSSQLQYVADGLIPWQQRPPEYLERLQQSGQIELEFSDAFVPVEYGEELQLVPVRQYRVRPKVFSY